MLEIKQCTVIFICFKKKRENFSFTIHLTGVACQGADLTTSAFPLVLVDQLSSHGKCVGN